MAKRYRRLKAPYGIMKTLLYSFQNFPLSSANPLNRSALPVFLALAFLPGLLCLILPDFQVTNLITAPGPVIAALWLAAGLREIRVHFMVLTTLVAGLLWSVNWMMMAGGTCCSTM